MGHGRSIRIFLADGSAAGIRHAEVVNWTGQAIVCPRSRIAELADWEECHRPGVYFLIGDDPMGSRPLVYVGEAESVYDRLKQHSRDQKKEFFDHVLLLTSKDANLTKAHVKYLESRMVQLARDVGRVSLENGNTPPRPALPRPDRAAMEEFIGPARLLMAALGFQALQPLSRTGAKDEPAPTNGPSGPLADTTLYLSLGTRGVAATGASTDEGFVVYKDSIGDAKLRKSLQKGWLAQRVELMADGSLRQDGDRVVFERDVLFRSPSAAASVTAGGVVGGRVSWKDAQGRTLADLEDALIGPEGGGA